MGKKYIIEIPEDKIVDFVGSTHFLMPYMMAGHIGHHDTGLPIKPYTEPDLERVKKTAHDDGYSEGYQAGREDLNLVLSDFERVRKEAYEQGQKDLRESCVPQDEEAYGIGYNEGFQCGLDLAWDAARKLWEIDISTLHKIFYKETRMDCYMYYTAAEVIAKIKEFEQEQEEIKVGNEVKAFEKKPFIVTGFGYGDNEEDVYCYGFVTENGISTSAEKNSCVRTGRHFPEIAAIFEKTRNESNAQIDTE